MPGGLQPVLLDAGGNAHLCSVDPTTSIWREGQQLEEIGEVLAHRGSLAFLKNLHQPKPAKIGDHSRGQGSFRHRRDTFRILSARK